MMVVLLLCGQLNTVFAEQTKSNSMNSSLSTNLRWAADLSTRYINKSKNIGSSWQHVVGLDMHKVFSNEKGDFGTLLFQPYLVKLSNVQNPPFNFSDGDDWELTWRMANFNYTGLAQGKFNVRAGHFEVPFGLEQNLDTNGTIRQFTFSERGIKADWGMSLNGILEKLEYEIAVTRGSGSEFKSRDNPYLLSGRLGTLSNNNLVIGLSGFAGEILNATGTSNVKRVGFDVEYYIYQWQLLGEITGGTTNSKETANFFTEVSWRSPLETFHVYSQFRQNFKKIDNSYSDSTSINVGFDYDIKSYLSVSSELTHNIETISGNSGTTNFIFQLRIRI